MTDLIGALGLLTGRFGYRDEATFLDPDSNLVKGVALPRFAAVRSPVRGAFARVPTQRKVGGCGRLPNGRVESVWTA